MRENCTYGIDEGELEIEPFGHYASSLLYGTKQKTKTFCDEAISVKVVLPT